jgi:hypothetical protein
MYLQVGSPLLSAADAAHACQPATSGTLSNVNMKIQLGGATYAARAPNRIVAVSRLLLFIFSGQRTGNIHPATNKSVPIFSAMTDIGSPPCLHLPGLISHGVGSSHCNAIAKIEYTSQTPTTPKRKVFALWV